jgi:hypothetical protein
VLNFPLFFWPSSLGDFLSSKQQSYVVWTHLKLVLVFPQIHFIVRSTEIERS